MPRPRLSEEQKKINRKETLRKYHLKQVAIGNSKNLNIKSKEYYKFEEYRKKGEKLTQAQFLNKLLDVYEKRQADSSKSKSKSKSKGENKSKSKDKPLNETNE
jgi:hypothetical protein